MNNKIVFAVLVLMIGSSVASVPAFASPYALPNLPGSNVTSGNTGVFTGGNTGGIIVTTNKSSYKDGDVVTISGTISNYVSNTMVNLRILSPNGNIVVVNQVNVGSDRTFSTSVTATGPLWQDGIQTVKVQYGSPDISSQTTFQFSGSSNPSASPPTAALITTNIDKTSYTLGDTIVISGQVQSVVVGTPLVIQILDPNNSRVQDAQVGINPDGKYTDTIKAVGPYWKLNGVYTVKVQYGPPNVTAETTFVLGSSQPTTNVIKVTNPNTQQVFLVQYTINGGALKEISTYTASPSLMVSINSVTDGSITLQIPRSLLDAKLVGGQDTGFNILIDGAEIKPQSEQDNTDYRVVTIVFLQGDQDIQIIGTNIFNGSHTPSPTYSSTITVTTDKTSYSDGNVITISGTVSGYISNIPVSIRVNDPSGNIVRLAQTNVESDRTFSATITDATGTNWKQAGTYSVTAIYGNPNIISQTTFQFSGSSNSQQGNASTITVTTDKSSYTDGDILIISGMINNYISNPSVTVSIISPSGGLVVDDLVEGFYKTYTKSLVPTGVLWQQAGTYTVKVQYNDRPDTVAQTTFQFSGSSGKQLGSPLTALITARVDKSSYTYGDTITVSGQVQSVSPGTQVVIQIFDPGNNLVQVSHVDASQNGVYVDSIPITESYWKSSGTYTIKVQCGPANVTAGTSFVFSSSSDTITIDTDKQVYDHNSLIIIKGHVTNVIAGQDVNMKITSPSGNVVASGQISIDDNGDFSTHISTIGNLWFENGQYTLAVQQGENQTRFDSTIFQISGEGPVIASSTPQATTPMVPVISPTQQDIENINQAKNNQTIAAEVNVGNNKTETTSIDGNVTVKTTSTTPDSLGVTVNASSQTGPKVIVFNLNATTINVSNLKDLGVTYDGKSISPAPNMDAILHAKSTDNPSFAIVVTQSGVQVLVLVPHFSEHTITITNMSKVIPSVPEFGPVVGIVAVVTIIGSIIASRFFKV